MDVSKNLACAAIKTLRNLQTAMGKDFDKPVAEWKVRLEENFTKTLFFEELLQKQRTGTSIGSDDNMETCTIDIQKNTVGSYTNFIQVCCEFSEFDTMSMIFYTMNTMISHRF